MKEPKQSYTIWFSQRTGSTLLCDALSSTGVAGIPREWITFKDPDTMSKNEIEGIWKDGTTLNGVFGIKACLTPEWIDGFRKLFELSEATTHAEVWRTAFPSCNKHIWMTRRNKVRLAVSWW